MGVHQGDPLSPLSFCLAEYILSRGISMLVSNGGLELIMSSRNNLVPSHIFYANRIKIYCTGKHTNIQALKQVFQNYSIVSGQTFNLSKYFVYSGSTTNSQLEWIISNNGFKKGSLPFDYLGISIFKGRPKSILLSPISEKIIQKLVVHNMISYSINIYSLAGFIT